jgi:tryptophanyl-tRNA synthetase
VKNKELLRNSTLEIAATFLALGLDPNKASFFRQQDVPEVTELGYILNCITPVGVLQRAHAYKTAKENGFEANAGLFTYPVLMAADILAFNTDLVPVGKDQTQHIEICKDLAQRFNHHFGDTLKIPEILIRPDAAKVVGLDGRKMGKSYSNTIEIFLPEKELKKKIMSIVTDSLSMAEPKAPETCNVFQLYKAIASPKEHEALADKYRAGNFGYGHAKLELFRCLNEKLKKPREKYNDLLNNPEYIFGVLEEGAAKARPIAQETLRRVRDGVGL